MWTRELFQLKGKIFDLVYIDEHNGEKAKGFFSKLFR